MNDILAEICTTTRGVVAATKLITSTAELDNKTRTTAKPRGFINALKRKIEGGKIGFITEIKKASPSAGIIRPDFSPAAIAKAYEGAGAACLSVLTDRAYFQGKNEDLIEARAACALPVLRKDFMIDTWQVTEARAMGADCILIIMAAVDDALASDLHHAATDYGMDVLIETHNQQEMERALNLPSGMIGINNRNLKTLKTDLATTEELAPLVPPDRLLVCESGIATAADIHRMRASHANCFLVGESLLKQSDVSAALNHLRA